MKVGVAPIWMPRNLAALLGFPGDSSLATLLLTRVRKIAIARNDCD